MKFYMLSLILFSAFQSSAQINTSDIKEFINSLNLKRQIYAGTNAYATEVMSATFPNHTPLELAADFETMAYNISVFDRFCYQVVLHFHGDRENSGQLLMNFCGSAVLALKIVDYIKIKFKNKLVNDIAAKKLLDEKEAKVEEAKIRKAQEDELATTKEEEKKKLAKEKYDKENIPAYYSNNPSEFNRFFAKNFQYPDPSQTGKIIVSFIIRMDGSLDSLKIVSSTLDVKFQNELIRVLKLSKWHPAFKNNQLADEEKTMPFTFGNQE